MKKRFSKGLNLERKEVKEMMKRMMLLLPAVLALSLMLYAPQVLAYPMVTGSYNGLFFNDAEVLLDKTGPGEVSIGDTFWGVAQIQSIKNAYGDPTGQTGPTIWALGGVLGPPQEITAYFATDVIDIGLPSAPLTIGGLPNNPISIGSATIATIILGPPAIDPKGILGPGAVMNIYQDATMDYDDSTQALALATAATNPDNILHSVLGLSGGYWYTLAPVVPPGSGDVGESFAGLNYISSPFGTLLINDPNEDYSSGAGVPGGLNVDLFFNAELFQLNPITDTTHMHFGSNDPAVQFPIPEPSSLLLLGAGLIGIAAFGRKRLLKK